MPNDLPLRCRWGFHKWLYVGWPNHPFYDGLVNGWRGCMLCHKDQYQLHRPTGAIRGQGGMALLTFEWENVPNMRIKSNWQQFQHPAGWTNYWIEIPFEGLQSLQTQEEINERVHSIAEVGPAMCRVR